MYIQEFIRLAKLRWAYELLIPNRLPCSSGTTSGCSWPSSCCTVASAAGSSPASVVEATSPCSSLMTGNRVWCAFIRICLLRRVSSATTTAQSDWLPGSKVLAGAGNWYSAKSQSVHAVTKFGKDLSKDSKVPEVVSVSACLNKKP